jgi:uncharacterized protein
MKISEKIIPIKLYIFTLLAGFLCLTACEKNDETTVLVQQPVQTPAPVVLVEPAINAPQTQFTIGNKSYLFDVSDHSLEELELLLKRAQEISQFDKKNYDDLEIVMILHGPDIDWFTQQNYEKNRQLIDLAAELDAFDIIDMKVCETSMNRRGVKREDIPAFIESVPYAPDEMKKLTEEGYINL